MKDLVSIIVPVYNVQKYLDKCIESMLKQTYTNIEIVLVDDGSTDGSALICDKYAADDERIVVVHKKNGGQSDARNVGREKSTGEYICWVDGDDCIEENMIELLHKNLVDNNADISICNYHSRYESDGRKCKDITVRDGIWTRADFWNNYYNENQYYCVVLWNKMFRKRLFSDVHFPVGRISEDAWVMGKIVSRAETIYASDADGYEYTIRSGSSMQTSMVVSWLSAVEACIERTSYFEEEKDYINLNKNMAYIIRTMVNSKKNAAFTEVSDLYKKDKCNVKNVYKKYRKLLSSKTKLQYMIFMISEKLYGRLMKA